MIKLWLWPICLIDRHHWLLQGEEPVSYYDPEMKRIYESIYDYRCQRCGTHQYQNVINLDNESVSGVPEEVPITRHYRVVR